MRIGTIRSSSFLLLVSFLLITTACAQSEAEKLKLSYQHEDKALELRQKGDIQGAIREQQKAIELNSNDSKPLTVLAGMYIEEKNWQKVKDVSSKAVKLNPKDAWAHYLLAQALDNLGNNQESLKERRIASDLEPDNTLFLVNLGVAQELSGDNKAARESYKKAVSINPDYIYGLYRLGLLEAEEGNLEKAKQIFEKIIQTKPTEEGDEKFIEEIRQRLEQLERASN